MKIPLLLLLLALAAPAVPAQEGDPLKSDACAAALASLQAARRGTGGTAVEDLRSAAAATCLGSAALPTRPSRVLQQPIAVPPPQIEVAPGAAPLPAPVPPAAPVAIERAPQPALCDAGGCWSNEGTHLRHVPFGMPGPRGLCMQQGGVVYCP